MKDHMSGGGAVQFPKVPFARIKLQGGGTYVQPMDQLGSLVDEIKEGEVGEVWTVEKIEMDENEYSALPEFTGH